MVTEPTHSIIHQSYHANERTEPLNGDGFGIAWFASLLLDQPAIFKHVSPAWNNPNLHDIARVSKSTCILAHVRAATVGGDISRNNCHPFAWKNFTFMHNGSVHGFAKIKRKVQQSLSDEAFEIIQGNTDTEHLFAIFVDQIRDIENPTLDDISSALKKTIKQIEEFKKHSNVDEPSSLNLLVSNGKLMVASKYSTPNSPINSLYYHRGSKYSCEEGVVKLKACSNAKSSVLIASEALNQDDTWEKVEKNSLVLVDENRTVLIERINTD